MFQQFIHCLDSNERIVEVEKRIVVVLHVACSAYEVRTASDDEIAYEQYTLYRGEASKTSLAKGRSTSSNLGDRIYA
uniref:Uncharacterized protein n=1 Tax=Loa loa TaxID=7209 RepID=A0A1I7VPX3_LOALO